MTPRLVAVALALLLGGCVTTAVAPGPEGVLDVLGGYPPLGLGAAPRDREARGFFTVGSPEGIAPATVEERPSVRFTAPGRDGAAGRKTAAPLLATPFLQWRWRTIDVIANEAPGGDDDAPMMLLVGFSGGLGPTAKDSPGLPFHQRMVSIVWSRRGDETGAVLAKGPYARFVARSGDGGRDWWEHALDLADLHRHLWPRIPGDDVEVTFIALASRATTRHGVAEIADVVLTR